MILLSASKVWLWVQRDGGIWSFLTWTKNHFLLHWHPEVSLEVVKVETLVILLENLRPSPRIGWYRIKVDVLSSWSPPIKFDSSICDWKFEFSIFWEILLPLHWVFWSRFQSPQCLQPICHPSKFTPRTNRIRGTIQARLSFQIDGFLNGLSERLGHTQQVNQTEWSVFKRFSKTSFVWSLSIRQEILNVSQIGIAHFGICHHFSSRPDCNNTADVPSFTLRTALSAIPFVSDLCGVDVQWFQERSSEALPNSKKLSV